MTEADWAAATDPYPMLNFLCLRPGERKLRLLGCACARRVWGRMTGVPVPEQVEVSERFADGDAGEAELAAARSGLARVPGPSAAWEAYCLLWSITDPNPELAASRAVGYACGVRQHLVLEDGRPSGPKAEAAAQAAYRTEMAELTAVIREVYGNPVRPAAVHPRWLTADVVGLARGIYEERAFDRLPILADALLDAGCDDEDLLAHCRSDGPHVRGCWAVDLIHGKGAGRLYLNAHAILMRIANAYSDDGTLPELGEQFEAAVRARPEVVRETFPDDGDTYLHDAARLCLPQSVGSLCRHGADPNARDRTGQTPIHYLLRLHEGADESSASVEVVRILLDHGADANAVDDAGVSALYSATACTYTDCAALLIERGAVLDLKTSALTGNVWVVQDLLNRAPDPRALVQSAPGLVHDVLRARDAGSVAVPPFPWGDREDGEDRRERIFKLLLRHGLNPNAIVDDGLPLLAQAVSEYHLCGAGTVAALVEHGADINAVVHYHGKYRTPIEFVPKGEQPDTYKLLKKLGAKTYRQLQKG